MTQPQRIVKYLKRHKWITPMEAFSELGITKLATRVSEMRRDGYEFEIEMVTKKNRYGEPVRFARYRLIKEAA